MAYRPGQGIDRKALDRLKGRRVARQRGDSKNSEPSADTSAQAARLMGSSAKKVPRCGQCTRPLDAAAMAAAQLACTRCVNADEETAWQKQEARQEAEAQRRQRSANEAPAGRVRFLQADADKGVDVSGGGAEAACDTEDAWLGVRALPAVYRGAYCVEFELLNDCLLRLGWGAPNSRRALGTDDRSFGYGGTAMKSHCNKFDPYGQVYEGAIGAVVTCLLDRRDPRRQSIAYMLDGEDLGVAFRLPLWMAGIPLLPAVCGREDWRVAIRGADLRFRAPEHFRPLAELSVEDGAGDEADCHAKARDMFSPAPQECQRELGQLDVPDENLVEFRSAGDEVLDEDQLLDWLWSQCEVPTGCCHMELAATGHSAVGAFADHRVAHGVLSLPPPYASVHCRGDFSETAEELLLAQRPENRGQTTNVVARRFIAGALAADAELSKEQRRQLRSKGAPREAAACVDAKRPERSWRSRSRAERPGAAARLRPTWRLSAAAGEKPGGLHRRSGSCPRASSRSCTARTSDGRARARLAAADSHLERGSSVQAAELSRRRGARNALF